MVKSKLDDSIDYVEQKKIDDDDINHDATMYELAIMNNRVIIALGKPKYTYIDKNIEYYHIYLIKKNNVLSQIGVYEFMSSNLPNILDADGDLNLDLLYDPLLYRFVNHTLIEKASLGLLNPEEELEVESEKDESDSENEIEIEEKTELEKSKRLFDELPEQTKTDAEREYTDYIDKSGLEWIQKYMHSNNYGLFDNEGGGECFFAAIRDGLARAGVKVTIEELRLKLSENVDQETFDNYYKLYNEFVKELEDVDYKINALAQENKTLQARLKDARDKKEQIVIVERGKAISSEYKKLKEEKMLTKTLLEEFKFMKKIDTLDKFSDIIKTCNFWADTWAISTIERLYGIKVILLSEEAYNSKDFANVLNCGQLNDHILQARGSFEPKYYIMLDYTGNHYKLITYKSRGALKFKELPYAIKKLIIDKCLEKQAGPYYIIPEFKQLRDEVEIQPEIPEVVEIQQADYWNDDTVFQYYIKSNPKPLPGKGTGEQIGSEGVKAYSALYAIPEWRRKLDDLWESKFELDGHSWLSVEHFYQASKYKNSAPQYYYLFTIESGSEISKSPAMAKAAGSKTGKFEGKQLRPKNIVADADFFGSRKKITLKAALQAKFSQNEELKSLLLSTKKAKLTHFIKGSAPETSTELMEVRYELNQNK
jgi:predicted NAD-dependent protein-ADP-ribosyltransferase YbiA (DUF1768 family)